MYSHASASASHVHRGDQGPGVVFRVVSFHAVQTVPRLGTTDHVHKVIQLAHGCLVPPCTYIHMVQPF